MTSRKGSESSYGSALELFTAAFERRPSKKLAERCADSLAKMGQKDEARAWREKPV